MKVEVSPPLQHPLMLDISDASQVGAARRTAIAIAASIGFCEVRQAELALIVTEVASNIFRHAANGELYLRVREEAGELGIELIAIDKGPGMSNVRLCMEDGYSTAGTPGNGLGAIHRQSDFMEIYSMPGAGTVLTAQLWADRAAVRPKQPFVCGIINRAKPGQEVCGDHFAVEHLPDRSLFLVVDGLGHGPDAAEASREAVLAFRRSCDRQPKDIVAALHVALRSTRGAAVGIAEITPAKKQVCFAGIGNISGMIVTPTQTLSMVSHNGIVGHQVRKIQEFHYQWQEEALLILHSDGISNRWQWDRYPGLRTRHPSLIAGVLYRDLQRQTDDATILVGARALVGEPE